jgi:class 3 adenylate cyclase
VQLAPHDVAALINELAAIVESAISQYRLVKVDVIGDGAAMAELCCAAAQIRPHSAAAAARCPQRFWLLQACCKMKIPWTVLCALLIR